MKLMKYVGVAALAGAVFATTASADPIADFYKGKRLQMLVGSSPGGGYDTYARLVTRHLSRHIPGNPPWVRKNLPGPPGPPRSRRETSGSRGMADGHRGSTAWIRRFRSL